MASLTTKAFLPTADKRSMSQEDALEALPLLTAFSFFLVCQVITIQASPHRAWFCCS